MSSGSNYPGYDALVTYLRYQVKRSYRGFLELNRNVIIASLSSNLDTEELDNLWSCHFLCEAKEILTQENREESFVKLKEKVEFERSCKWLKQYWDGVIKDYRRTQLKRFAYKIIYYETPERIPEEHQKSDLCGICRNELLPQLTEHITILTCGHLFHWQCIERISFEPCCPFCSEEQGSTKKRTIDNSDERNEYDDHDNDYYNRNNDSDHGNSLDEHSFDHDNNNHHNDSDDIPAPEIANLLQEGRLNDDGQRAHPAVPVDNNHHENTNNHHEGDEHNHDHNHEGFGSGLGPRPRRRRVRDSSYHPRVAKTIKKIHHRNESTISAGDHYDNDHDHEQEDYDNDHNHEQRDEELIGPAEQAETNQIITLDQSNSNSSNPQTRSRRCSSSPPSSREQNMLQGLIRELFPPINEETVETNGNNDAGEEFQGSIPLTMLFRKACRAETQMINVNQEEISCWYRYGKGYMERVDATMNFQGCSEKTARKVVYDDIMKHLPGFNRNTVRNKTQGALRIYNLFKKIGTNRIKWIRSFSSSFISKLTTTQIQTIVGYYDHI